MDARPPAIYAPGPPRFSRGDLEAPEVTAEEPAEEPRNRKEQRAVNALLRKMRKQR